MNIFSLLVLTLAEAERLANSDAVPQAERIAARQLHTALQSIKGAAFRLREYAPSVAQVPAA